MTSASYKHVSEWRRRQITDLRMQYTNRCWQCGSEESLEFAHRHGMETLQGSGRGLSERIYDIRRNPLNYLLLCKDCHRVYDSGPRDQEQDPRLERAELEAFLTALGFQEECP